MTTLASPGVVDPAMYPVRNRVLNGDFDVWQHLSYYGGTSRTFTGSNAFGYTADRYQVALYCGSSGSGSGTLVVSRQQFTAGQTEVPDEPTYYMRSQATAVGTVGGTSAQFRVHHCIEDVRTWAGKKVTVSFWARADANRTFAFMVGRYFGTGGSPSSRDTAYQTTFNVTTVWQKFTFTFTMPSISGKTLGTDGPQTSCIALLWYMYKNDNTIWSDTLGPIGSMATQYMDLAHVQALDAPCDTQFWKPPAWITERDCMRFAEYIPSMGGWTFVTYTSNGDTRGRVPLKARKRITPSGQFSTTSWVVIGVGPNTSPVNVTVSVAPGAMELDSFGVGTGTQLNGYGAVVSWGSNSSVAALIYADWDI